jgi:hypothetical protein
VLRFAEQLNWTPPNTRRGFEKKRCEMVSRFLVTERSGLLTAKGLLVKASGSRAVTTHADTMVEAIGQLEEVVPVPV